MYSKRISRSRRAYLPPNRFSKNKYFGFDELTLNYLNRVFAGSGRIITPENAKQIDRFVRGARQQGLLNNLISYWMLGENVNSDNRSNILFDLMPTGNNLTGGGSGTNRPIKQINSSEFTGSLETRYQISSNSTLQNQDSFSFACWIRAKQLSTRKFIIFKGNATSGNSDEYSLEWGQFNQMALSIHRSSGAACQTIRNGVLSMEWLFAIARYDHSVGQCSISINGDNFTFGSAIAGFIPQNNSTFFGLATTNFTGFSDLYIRNFGFWKRLLTQSEVNWLYMNT